MVSSKDEFVKTLEKLYGLENVSRRDEYHYQKLTEWVKMLMRNEQAYIDSLPSMREPVR